MVLSSNADNKFGVSPFIVGEVLGAGCNYAGGAGIQSAINDCFAAGGGTVYIRSSSTPYIVDLTLLAGVDLFGCSVDGRPPSVVAKVVVQGAHTFAPVAGFTFVLLGNISFINTAGTDAFTINPTAGAQCIFVLKYCGVDSNVAGGRCFNVTPDAISAAIVPTEFSNCSSDMEVIIANGPGVTQIQAHGGSYGSNSAAAVNLAVGTGFLVAQETQIQSNGGPAVTVGTGTSGVNGDFSSFQANAFPCIDLTVASGAAETHHCTFDSNAGSGFYVDGVAGTVFKHLDSGVTGNARAIGTTENVISWQPYAQTAAMAVGSNRGTSSFDSSQFTVTDGWVHLTSFSSFTWIDQGANTVASSNTGYFATAVINLQMPAAPVQGDVIKVKNLPGLVTIQTNAGQTLQVANQTSSVGTGLAVSTQVGDAMELTYQASTQIWCANNIIGNWMVS